MPISAARRQEYDYAWRRLRELGQRSHNRSRFRTVGPLLKPVEPPAHILDRWVSLAAPWSPRPWTCPGLRAILLVLCGVRSHSTTTHWRKRGIPPAHCERLARFLKSRIERELAMVAELRAYAAAAESVKLRPYFERELTIDERYRIAAGKRAKREALRRARASAASSESSD